MEEDTLLKSNIKQDGLSLVEIKKSLTNDILNLNSQLEMRTHQVKSLMDDKEKIIDEAAKLSIIIDQKSEIIKDLESQND